jgi:hypothetical protein
MGRDKKVNCLEGPKDSSEKNHFLEEKWKNKIFLFHKGRI